MMDKIRKNPPTKFGKYDVIEFRDYKLKKIKNLETNVESETTLPESNVLYFDLSDSAWCCVRPSGTEPKIKFYIGVREDTMDKAEASLKELGEFVKTLEEN